jgi:predicted nucleotidyltransferase
MGRVFAWEEIAGSKLPSPGLLSFATYNFRKELERLVTARLIYGALLCGSVVRGDANIRSDIDCLVAPFDSADPRLSRELGRLLRVAENQGVELELIVVEADEEAPTKFHTITRSFYQHLANSLAQGMVIGRDPLPLIDLENRSSFHDVAGYLTDKLRGLQRGLYRLELDKESDHPRYRATLKRALEAPVRVARLMIWWKTQGEFHDSQEEVLEKYRNLFWGFPELIDWLGKVVKIDDGYTKLMEEIVQGKRMSRQEYERFLSRIEVVVPLSILFIRGNLDRLAHNTQTATS